MNNTDQKSSDSYTPVISVIVPVYNVEQYLTECVESILGQTWRNFELILVDDGSKDRSGSMCDEYAEKDPRIRVIHKKNGGLSDARNAGMDIMLGEYVTFIDSDDYVTSEYLRVLFEGARKYKADIVQCDFSRNPDDLSNETADAQYTVIKGGKILHDFLRFKTPSVLAWGKLYRAGLFEDVRFPVGLIDEDNHTTYKLMIKSKIFASVDQKMYYYRITPNSITQVTFNSKRLGRFYCVDKIREYLGEKEHRYDRDLKYYQMRMGVQIFNDAIKAGKEKEFKQELKPLREFLKSVSAKEIGEGMKYTISRYMIIHDNPLYKAYVRRMRKTY